jgi:hypothetical protein
MWIQGIALKTIAILRSRVHSGNVLLVDPQPPAAGLLEPGEQSQQRRLATAGRPYQNDEGPVRDVERDVIYCQYAAESFHDIFDSYLGHRDS